MKVINIKSKERKYKIIIQNNLIKKLNKFLDENRFYVIISDDKIPQNYINIVKTFCPKNITISFPSGESSKSFKQFQKIIATMQENNVDKEACIIALGGGVTGDLSGFVASTYLRGIDYIQIPTTLLSQIDSSVGGKVAINTEKAKNSVGNFYPPSYVFIDPLTLISLDKRQFNNGMAEMIKYGMIYSRDLFDQIVKENISENLEYFIYESLLIKKSFVENDEFDNSSRKILNYGHTYGHAYEAFYKYKKYLHGEAISLGMLKVCDNIDTKNKLLVALNKYNLPTCDEASNLDLLEYIKNDKKINQGCLDLIVVDEIGKAYIKKINI